MNAKEKIAELELDLDTCTTIAADSGLKIRLKGARITELEQENQRLREALLEAANWIEGSCVWPEEHTFYVRKYRAIAQNKE